MHTPARVQLCALWVPVVLALPAFAKPPASGKGPSTDSALPCPFEIKSWEVLMPTQVYSESQMVPYVQAKVVSHALPQVSRLDLAIKLTANLQTVSGAKRQDFTVSSTDSALGAHHQILYEAPQTINFDIPGVGKYEDPQVSGVSIKTVEFANGSVCRDGKLTKHVDMTLPAPFTTIKPMLVDLLCLFDPGLPPAKKAPAEQALRDRLPKDKRSATLQIELWAILENPATRPAFAPAMTAALKRCPGVIKIKDLLEPRYWQAWPCPKCIEACTATSTEEAISDEADPADIARYGTCISHCTANCNDATLAEIAQLEKSDRLHNYPPQGAAAANARTSPAPTSLFGIDLTQPASKALERFQATPKTNFAQDCKSKGTKCFELHATSATRIPDTIEGIRVVIKDDKIIKLAFKLGASEEKAWPATGPGLVRALTKMLGPPNEQHPECDYEADDTLFPDQSGLNLMVGMWVSRLGRFDGNVLGFSPGYGEGSAAELLFRR